MEDKTRKHEIRRPEAAKKRIGTRKCRECGARNKAADLEDGLCFVCSIETRIKRTPAPDDSEAWLEEWLLASAGEGQQTTEADNEPGAVETAANEPQEDQALRIVPDPRRAEEAQDHARRCKRLKRFYSHDLKPDDKYILEDVDDGMDELIDRLQAILLEHGERLQAEATQKEHTDATLFAMVAAMRLRQRLDPEKLFAPKRSGSGDRSGDES